MGCASSKHTLVVRPISSPKESISTPLSMANCSVDGLFICEVSSDYLNKTKSRILTFSSANAIIIQPVTSIEYRLADRVAPVIDKLCQLQYTYLAFRCFSSWRLVAMKSKQSIYNSLMLLAKQPPKLTDTTLPQLQGI